MIEKMKKVVLLAEGNSRERLLVSLREAGVMHVTDLVMKSPSSESLESGRAEYAGVLQTLEERKDKKDRERILISGPDFEKVHSSLKAAIEREAELMESIIALQNERERILPFGEFDPEAVRALAADGIPITLCIIGKKEEEMLRADGSVRFIPVAYSGKGRAVALLDSSLPSGVAAQEFRLPEKSLAEIDAALISAKAEVRELGEKIRLGARYIPSYEACLREWDEKITFERVSATVEGEDIIYLTGYIPEKYEKKFRSFAEASSFAYMISEPTEEDNPPTLVAYRGITRIVKPVFDILGTVPGYREYDISSWFLVFFSLFFAMIIGDAGYGLVFLLIAVLMQVKSKKASDLNILLYVLSVVTIIWGALTGTWFGSEAVLEHLPFLKKLIIPAITNFPDAVGVDATWAQNMLMKFCFILGAVQLGLARVMNIVRKAKEKDLSLVAEAGWFLDVVMLYMMALYLVIGQAVPFGIIVGGIALGFVLVCCFSAQGPGVKFSDGLKASLGGFFTTFLDTISCFSNIMSYIRLFAVGMASLAIAQSFNGMAEGLLSGFTLPLGIAVIVIGHLLNLVMGILSVVVHGVRLNLLEFSGALGMEWTGYNYEPFRKMANDKADNS